jgi:hypothetical protein
MRHDARPAGSMKALVVGKGVKMMVDVVPDQFGKIEIREKLVHAATAPASSDGKQPAAKASRRKDAVT